MPGPAIIEMGAPLLSIPACCTQGPEFILEAACHGEVVSETSNGGKAMRTLQPSTDDDGAGSGVSRRAVLRGAAAAGLASGLAGGPAEALGAGSVSGSHEWAEFGAAVGYSFRRMRMVGAAVAVVSADEVLYTSTHGVRDRATGQPVTNDTHFLVASTTKSMSSLLVATFVDDGLFGWDQPVVEVWPQFRAPTDELTKTLRVRDLMGMDSGITEPAALSALHEGDPTAAQLLQSVVNLPVEYPPGSTFFYNNTVYAVGGYLPALAQGIASADLEATYSWQMHERVYGPVGMATATIADDPRGVVDRYARGYGPDLRGRRLLMPYGAVGSYAPVGGTLATLTDMAAYVRMQLRNGTSVDGVEVVSAANLAECWKPHVEMPTSPELDPDVVSAGYGMGWIHQTYRDGTSLVWHNGGIDGFTTLIGFLPERDIGLVVLNNMNPASIGFFFYLAVLNHLLSQRFGLNEGVNERIEAAYDEASARLGGTWKRTIPVDHAAVAPYAGYYQGGYRLLVDGEVPTIRIGSRVMPLRALSDGAYVTTSGLVPGIRIHLTRGSDRVPRMELEGLETVSRTVGFD
jgi:CubicO group peptidase (beta-lactamase class C family)